jgi:RNA polymerase sigma-70 factor (ECF subfamily)
VALVERAERLDVLAMVSGNRKSATVEAQLLPQLEAGYRFAFQLTRQEADAEDLLQEAAKQVIAKHHLFEAGTNFKAWFFRIIRNLHIDQVRRRKRAPTAEDLSRRYKAETTEDAIEEIHKAQMERRERGAIENEEVFYDLFGDEVNRFLAELPAEFRGALLLCDLEGFSYKEIGGILDCPIGTVRSRISRARSFLKEKLHDYARSLGYVKGPKV